MQHSLSCLSCSQLITPLMNWYKCLQCDQTNLCGVCYEKQAPLVLPHRYNHPHILLNQFGYIQLPEKVLDGIQKQGLQKSQQRALEGGIYFDQQCTSCASPSIEGMLYKCDVCPAVCLCHDCYLSSLQTPAQTPLFQHHYSHHPILVFLIQKNWNPHIESIDQTKLQVLGQGRFSTVYSGQVAGIS